MSVASSYVSSNESNQPPKWLGVTGDGASSSILSSDITLHQTHADTRFAIRWRR